VRVREAGPIEGADARRYWPWTRLARVEGLTHTRDGRHAAPEGLYNPEPILTTGLRPPHQSLGCIQ
jgi:hypothetical protein